LRDEVDERLYCNGPPEPITQDTVPKNVPTFNVMQMRKMPVHIQIVSFTPQSKYQLQWVPREEAEANYSSGGQGGMYWDMESRPFASVERYRNWLETGIAESDRGREYREGARTRVAERNEPNTTSISGCAKDNWFWIMIGISGTIITLIISNNELGWLPKEMFADMAGGFIFYLTYTAVHLIPLAMVILGGWGVISYCNTIACDRDHFTIAMSMVFVTAGILIFYAVLNAHTTDGFVGFWEAKEKMVELSLDRLK
jgi:hypothetical protein